MTTSDNPLRRQAGVLRRRTDQWQRWQPASLHEPATPQPAHFDTQQDKETAPPPPPDAKTLRARLQQAEQEARAAGHEKGYDAGYQEGLKQGQEDGYQAGHEQGKQEGLAQGEAAGSEQARQTAEQLDQLLQTTGQALANIESDMGQPMVTLPVRIAEKVLHDSLATRPQHLLALVDRLVHADTEHQSPLTIHVSAADLSLVTEHIANNPEKSQWRAVADDHITAGGCRISTPLGDIDATLETRWKRVVSTLGES